MSIDMEIDDLPRKRAKTSSTLTKPKPKPTKRQHLFAPFRTLGLITSSTPFILQVRSHPSSSSSSGPKLLILTSLGRSWALWDGSHMTLLFAGPDVPEGGYIKSMEMDGDSVWCSSGKWVMKYIRGKEVLRAETPLGNDVGEIKVFGKQVLGLTEDGRWLLGWNTSSGELEISIEVGERGEFRGKKMLHPATYLNKILVASEDGDMQLWNIQTSQLIHSFSLSKLLGPSHTKGQRTSITALVQSPAIDVVGIGFSDGSISVYDIRADELLMSMFMEGGGITGISFRSDGHPILSVSSTTGHLALFDLNQSGKLLHLVKGVHEGGVSHVEWVPGQGVLVSSGMVDNCVKVRSLCSFSLHLSLPLLALPPLFAFLYGVELRTDDDLQQQHTFPTPTSPPTLLRHRSGHSSPPHLIRYYGGDGKSILSASRDRTLRVVSCVRDSRSFELSQGSLQKKSSPLQSQLLPPITHLSYSSTRSNDWDDIVTSHLDEGWARSWTGVGKRVGRGVFGLGSAGSSAGTGKESGVGAGGKGKEGSTVGSIKAVHVTSCGNFTLAGTSGGRIGMWNLQSGVLRRVFDVAGASPSLSTEEDGKAAAKGTGKGKDEGGRGKGGGAVITGIVTDPLNRNVVASTLDGRVCFFDFLSTTHLSTLALPSPCVSLHMHPDSGLIATVCDDCVVRVVDFETRRVVREFGGGRGRVLDVTFSPTSRHILTTSLDSYIRTYDIPSGLLIDKLKTSSVATSISFSPTGDFLASAHVDSLGVSLWVNRMQFGAVPVRGVREDDGDGEGEDGEEEEEGQMPSVQGVVEDEELEALALSGAGEGEGGQGYLGMDLFSTPPQLDGELVTLTLLPRARWQTLLNFEVIQRRNKPKEPPKAPEKAPFFLPTLPGVETRFAVDPAQQAAQAAQDKKDKEKTKRLQKGTAELESMFLRKLMSEDKGGDYEQFFTYIKSLSPSALDLEIRSLPSSSSPSSSPLTNLCTFLHALTQRLSTRRDFELVQSLQKVFLSVHADILIESGDVKEVREALEKLAEVHKREGERMVELIGSVLGTLGFVRDGV